MLAMVAVSNTSGVAVTFVAAKLRNRPHPLMFASRASVKKFADFGVRAHGPQC